MQKKTNFDIPINTEATNNGMRKKDGQFDEIHNEDRGKPQRTCKYRTNEIQTAKTGKQARHNKETKHERERVDIKKQQETTKKQ